MHGKPNISSAVAPFPDTEPMPLAQYLGKTSLADVAPQAPTSASRGPDLSSLSLAPLEVSLYEALAEIRKDNRVCPQPTRWLEFYRVLQQAAAAGAALPAAPLTGSAWAATPSLAKRMCLREQVEWADAHGCLTPAVEFLKSLPDSDWHYMG